MGYVPVRYYKRFSSIASSLIGRIDSLTPTLASAPLKEAEWLRQLTKIVGYVQCDANASRR